MATAPPLSRLITKRLFSTSPAGVTITTKPQPSKSHHHRFIPSSSFPQGYTLNGIHCGIKKNPLAPDLTVILSTSSRETSAAACFTRNAFKAAPVVVSDEVLRKNGGRARGLVVNSGCANAVTGKQGLEDAWDMVKATDALLAATSTSGSGSTSISPGLIKQNEECENHTLVMSTGVIGQNLPISKIISGIKSFGASATNSSSTPLASNFDNWENAARGFMTTDTFPKLRARSFTVAGREFKLAGMDKGAGMIHPNMGAASTPDASFAPRQLHATLLGCVLTDAPVAAKSLQNALTFAVDRSFNSISVDGDMSTNDCIVVLANGAGVKEGDDAFVIDQEGTEEEKEAFGVFRKELMEFCADLAKLVVRDGEGATKFVTVTVKNAPTYRDAHSIASRISTSALVKTALYGEDANWGRILAATGSVPLTPSNADGTTPVVDPKKVSVTFVPSDGTGELKVLVDGEPEDVDEERASEILGLEDFEIVVDVGMGGEEEGEAKYWTCDFSYEYVRINGDYRS